MEEDAQAGPTAGTGRLFDCPWSLRSTAQTVLSFADTDSPWRARCEVRGMRSLAPAVRGRLEGWWVQMFSLVLVVSAVTCLSASRATALTAPAFEPPSVLSSVALPSATLLARSCVSTLVQYS